MSKTQTQHESRAKQDARLQIEATQSPSNVAAAPATITASIPQDGKAAAPKIGEWLRANFLGLICFALAARIAYTSAMVAISAPAPFNQYEADAIRDKATAGGGLAFVIYMVGTFFLHNVTAARWARATLFYCGAFVCASLFVWAVVTGSTDYGTQVGAALSGALLIGCGIISREGLLTGRAAMDRRTTVAHSKWAAWHHEEIDAITEDEE